MIAPFLKLLCIAVRIIINSSEELLYLMVPLSIQWPLARSTGLTLILVPLQPLLFVGSKFMARDVYYLCHTSSELSVLSH